MNTSLSRALLALAVVALLAVVLSLPVFAQDATQTPAEGDMGSMGMMTNCDSTLVLLVGLAQRYFGYTPSAGIDIGSFEYGQFGPLYDMSTMMGGDMSGTGGTDAQATSDPAMQPTTDASGSTGGEATSDPAMQPTTDASGSTSGDTSGTGGMMSGVMLNPPMIADEDPMCMMLRSDVEFFFNNEIQMGDFDSRFMGSMSGMGSDSGS
ncbi:MAG: hypothetical protein SF123_18495 [Chloroflexota bacterium]|nr:hypothetical protein [Chloroflexota bacterium]